MRVTINQKTLQREIKTGFFSTKQETKYFVGVRVELTDGELAIVDKLKLWERVVYTDTRTLEELYGEKHAAWCRRNPDLGPPQGLGPYHFQIRIKSFVDGFGRDFDTPLEAKNFEAKIRKEHLPALKSFIDGNLPGEEKSTTFEL